MAGEFAESGATFEDILKYGIVKYIDSEAGNPAAIAPSSLTDDGIMQTTATGTGTVTKPAGTIGMIGNVPITVAGVAGIGALLVGAFIVVKVAS